MNFAFTCCLWVNFPITNGRHGYNTKPHDGGYTLEPILLVQRVKLKRENHGGKQHGGDGEDRNDDECFFHACLQGDENDA